MVQKKVITPDNFDETIVFKPDSQKWGIETCKEWTFDSSDSRFWSSAVTDFGTNTGWTQYKIGDNKTILMSTSSNTSGIVTGLDVDSSANTQPFKVAGSSTGQTTGTVNNLRGVLKIFGTSATFLVWRDGANYHWRVDTTIRSTSASQHQLNDGVWNKVHGIPSACEALGAMQVNKPPVAAFECLGKGWKFDFPRGNLNESYHTAYEFNFGLRNLPEGATGGKVTIVLTVLGKLQGDADSKNATATFNVDDVFITQRAGLANRSFVPKALDAYNAVGQYMAKITPTSSEQVDLPEGKGVRLTFQFHAGRVAENTDGYLVGNGTFNLIPVVKANWDGYATPGSVDIRWTFKAEMSSTGITDGIFTGNPVNRTYSMQATTTTPLSTVTTTRT